MHRANLCPRAFVTTKLRKKTDTLTIFKIFFIEKRKENGINQQKAPIQIAESGYFMQ